MIPLATLNGLTPQQLELILAHEIAHIRRCDFLVNVLQTVVETLLFFHPSVWWISARIREEREHCCDDLAMSTLGADGRTYARALLAIEEWRGASIGLAAAASGGSLLRRVRRIVAGDAPAAPLGPRWIAGLLGVATVALTARGVVGASANPVAAPKTPAVAPAVAPAVFPIGRKQSDGRDSARARPSSVVRYDGSAALEERWRWAERQARVAAGDSVWIGYVVRGDAAGRRWYHFDRRVPVRIGRDSWSTGSTVFDGGSDLKDVSFSGTSLTPLVGEHAPYDVAIFVGVAPDRSGARVVRLHLGNFAFPVYFDRWPLVWLGEADDAESVALVERLRQTAPRELAADLVATVGVHRSTNVVVPALVAALDDAHEPEAARTEAAEWLGQHPDRRALAALARSARNEAVPHKVRESAIEATAHFALDAAADTVVALAQSLSDRDLRQTAIESMGHREEPRVFDALVNIVHDVRDADDQRNAVETLGNSLDKRRVDVLTGLARRDPQSSVRKQAVETLAQSVEGTDMVRTLVSIAMNDPDASVQETAVDQLAEIEDPSAVDALVGIAQRRGNVGLAKKAAEALGNSHVHEKAMAALSDLAWRSPEPEVQRTAVEALGEFEDVRAVELLADIANRHSSPDVQEAAAETLGQGHPHEAAMAALNNIVWKHKNERVQRAAVDGLGQFDEKRSTDLLLEIARRHPSAGVRKAALEALSN